MFYEIIKENISYAKPTRLYRLFQTIWRTRDFSIKIHFKAPFEGNKFIVLHYVVINFKKEIAFTS